MPTEVKMPKLGLTMEEGTVVEWLKAEGETVESGELLFVLETDKITFDVEAPQSGILGQIMVAAGTTVPTGTTVGLLLAKGEALPPVADAGVEEKQHGGEPVSQKVKATPVARRQADAAGLSLHQIPGTGPGGRVTAEDVQRAQAQMHDAAPRTLEESAPEPVAPRGRPPDAATSVKASPRAREIAAEAGLDLARVEGTGRQGRIMARDVERALASTHSQSTQAGAEPPGAPPEAEATGRTIPLTGVRGVIAERMAQSSRTTAAVTTTAQADATALVRLRDALREEWRTPPGRAPSYNDLLIVILGRALAEFPYMNARLTGDRIHLIEEINIGLAVDTDRGLLVPVLHGVEGMDLAGVTSASSDLVERARSGKLLPDDLSGGTFTLSNLGAYDVEASTPIINLPECAVLGVGHIAPRPAVVDGALCVRQTVTLSLSYDHRAIDGAPAARFLQRVKQLIEQPSLAFVGPQRTFGSSSSGGKGHHR